MPTTTPKGQGTIAAARTGRPALTLAVVPATSTALADSEAKALEAIEAIGEVASPEQAEELLRRITAYQQAVKLAKIGHEQERRWAEIRLRAERKMGELLGPVEPQARDERGRVTGGNTDGAERKAIHEARKVAAIPEDAFNAYLEEAEEPTRAGLLRKAAPKASVTHAPASRRARGRQAKVVGGVSKHARLISELAPHLDLATIRQISDEDIAGGNRQDWLEELSSARLTLTRLIGALRTTVSPDASG